MIHRNSKAKKVVLGHRVWKVRNNSVCKKKGLMKRKARGHVEDETLEAQGT